MITFSLLIQLAGEKIKEELKKLKLRKKATKELSR
jgi:hypothetical protein